MKRWTEKDIAILKEKVELGIEHKDIGIILNRTTYAVQNKVSRLKLKSKNNTLKTEEQYDAELKIKNPTTVRIDDYINDKTLILHRCLICGIEYSCTPSAKLQGRGHCGKSGGRIPSNQPGSTYLVHFLNEDLYKIGITSKTIKQRMSNMPEYEIILERHFDNGTEAMKLEAEWLKNVKHLKINTGLLRNGNTETFRWPVT